MHALRFPGPGCHIFNRLAAGLGRLPFTSNVLLLLSNSLVLLHLLSLPFLSFQWVPSSSKLSSTILSLYPPHLIIVHVSQRQRLSDIETRHVLRHPLPLRARLLRAQYCGQRRLRETSDAFRPLRRRRSRHRRLRLGRRQHWLLWTSRHSGWQHHRCHPRLRQCHSRLSKRPDKWPPSDYRGCE